MILEICVGNVGDAIRAQSDGADRLKEHLTLISTKFGGTLVDVSAFGTYNSKSNSSLRLLLGEGSRLD